MSSLPVIPELVNHCVVHHEQGIYRNVRIAFIGSCTPIQGAPLRDHLGPRVQPAGAFAGHVPKRSLCHVCERTKPERIQETDARVHDEMNSSMRPRFDLCLETNEIALKVIYHGLLTLRCEFIRQRYVGSGGKRCGIVAADPVRHGVCVFEVGESTAGNLIVIVGVTPTSHTASGIVIPESAILEIRCVYHKVNQLSDVETMH